MLVSLTYCKFYNKNFEIFFKKCVGIHYILITYLLVIKMYIKCFIYLLKYLQIPINH